MLRNSPRGIRNEDSTRTRTRPATAHDVKRPRVQPRAGPVLSMQETRRDTILQANGHQPNRLPDSETQQAMDLQKQPEPFATAPALGSTDLRPSTNSQMSDSLLRRSLLLHRKPMLVWTRREGWWEGANSLERREDGGARQESRGSRLRRNGPARRTRGPRAANNGYWSDRQTAAGIPAAGAEALRRPTAGLQKSDVRLPRGCAPRSVRSCVAHFCPTGGRYWHGSGGGGGHEDEEEKDQIRQ